ncbi:hypothetical protein M2171_002441 [Bradyrhizobium japonicum USDA 38]|uniref:hypothetical protein n=1 Tax=Bradyrhizobium japonicum TaxID=375 RepID=UPI000429A6EA|nr:hypothetical protein [Bradyrhizobium japonicum]MCS3893308.1 hypothetical protein [Bradyrhizobium japonicum USDA 38]MCS3945822.1 hypothetical protein [Bradyrhizobium japonicum]
MRSSTVDEINTMAKTFERLPDRPDGRTVPRHRAPKDREKAKAAQRLRTRVWRQANDRKGRPTSDQVAAALLNASAVARISAA